jgi:hypothetical protein
MKCKYFVTLRTSVKYDKSSDSSELLYYLTVCYEFEPSSQREAMSSMKSSVDRIPYRTLRMTYGIEVYVLETNRELL